MAQQEATLLLRIKKAGEEVLDEISDKFTNMTTLIAAAGAAVLGFGYLALKSWREQELASNQLAQAMVQQGVYTTELKGKYDEMAASLQKVTTFGDEQIQAAQATLQAFVGQREVTQELVQATLDLAAAKGMDLDTASQLVGKSIASETNALQRYGIEVQMSKDKTQQLANVIEALNGKFGGQAAAMAQGLGSIEQMKNQWSDFLENVGQRIAPGFTAAAQAVMGLFNAMNMGGSLVDSIGLGFHTLSSIVVVFSGLLEKLGGVAGTVLGGIAEAVTNMVQGNFKAAWQNAKDIVKISMDDWAATSERTMARLQEMDMNYLATKEGNLLKEEELMRASNERKAVIADEHKMVMDEKKLQQEIEDQNRRLVEQEMESMTEAQKLATQIRFLDEKIKAEENHQNKMKLVKQRSDMVDLQRQAMRVEQQKVLDKQREQDQQATLNTIATMQSSNNSVLAAIGKAAALTQIAIETPVAIAKALSAFPPPFNFAAAGLVGAAMAVQAARVSGIKLAEGGIVPAVHGGINATIGEGGRAEAVIPLPDDFDPNSGLGGGGGGVSVVFTGPVLGNDEQAREFAIKIDRELLKLRQRNESVSFDEGVI